MLTAARPVAAAVAGLLLAGVCATPALADTPPASPAPVAVPTGLYGKGDPTYDGVWRQSLAVLALAAEEVVPAESAVGWLTGQQCADGGWPSFRADTATPCDPATEDSNATAVAVQALVQLGGHQDAAGKGVQWLKDHQNADGSWAYNPGAPGDANSTGLAVNALVATGADPAGVAKSGKSAYDGLAAFQLGCAAAADQRGAFAYQPGPDGALAANTLASAQAALAAAGGRLPVAAGSGTGPSPKPLDCPAGSTAATVPHADAAEAVSTYLSAQLTAGGGHLVQSTPGATPGPDFTATSWAVLGLVRAGHPEQAAPAAQWLRDNGYPWAAQGKDGTDAAAAATLLLMARAAALDPYNFAGHNLVQLLIDAGPAPVSVPAATKAPATVVPDADTGISTGWLIGVGLLIGIGGGLLLSLSRRRGARRLGPHHVPEQPEPAAEHPAAHRPAAVAEAKPAAEAATEAKPAAEATPDAKPAASDADTRPGGDAGGDADGGTDSAAGPGEGKGDEPK
ncbi:prenyltransferase/squalene oxidase repeat-containing protein [Kitasatospora sp. NPDC049258]|uniref:prenyltransferase/squalene oxidase repeat-containing protein n=1 Tax=Kitasatospora sp. NPDC049258 TaxID=3155394 RepID=UPI0034202E3F